MTNQQLFDPGPKVPPKPTFGAQVKIETRVFFDITRFIQERLDEYIEFPLDEHFYDYWEKPLNFMYRWLGEGARYLDLSTFDGEAQESRLHYDIEIDFDHYDEEMTAALHEALGLNREGTQQLRPVS